MRYLTMMWMALCLAGCFTTTLSAPERQQVRILAQDEKAHFKQEFKDWYILGGLVPIYRHDIPDLIRDEHLLEVRVQTEDRVSDGVITFLTDYIFPIFPQSVVVDGNTAADIAQNKKVAPRSAAGS